MPLTIDGYPCLLPDGGQLAAWQERFQRLDETAFFSPSLVTSSDRNGTRYDNSYGTGLPVANWPEPPAPKLNTLYWPVVGASRFARGYFLVDEETADRIKSATTVALKLATDDDNGVSVRMTVQSLRPISSDQVDGTGVWLAVLVDQRCALQFKHCGALELDKDSTWAQVFAALATASGIAVDSPTVSADYLAPDWTELTRRYDNVGLLIDAAAMSVGLRAVFDTDGTVRYEASDDAQEYEDLNADDGIPAAGGDFLGGFGNATDGFMVSCPTLSYNHPYTDGRQYLLPGSSASNKRVVHSTCWASTTSSGTPDNLTKLTTLAAKIVADWTAWLDTDYCGRDETANGIYDPYVSGYVDAVLYTYDIDRPATRRQTLPANFVVEQQLSQDSDLVILNDLEFGQLYDDLTGTSGALTSVLRGVPGSEAVLSPDLQVKVYPWPYSGSGAAVKPVGIGRSSRSSDLAGGTKVWLHWHREHNKWYVLPSEWHYGVTDGTIAAASLSGGVYTPGTGTVSLYHYADNDTIKDTGVDVTALNFSLEKQEAGQCVAVKQHPQSGRWTLERDKPTVYGTLTYTGDMAYTDSIIPFDTAANMQGCSLDSNGIKLDASAPDGTYLVLLHVDPREKDAATLDDFNDAAFDTPQNTALDTRFKRDWLGATMVTASIFAGVPVGIQRSHIHKRTSTGNAYHGGFGGYDDPTTAVHVHSLITASGGNTIKGYLECLVDTSILEARLTLVYLGPAT